MTFWEVLAIVLGFSLGAAAGVITTRVRQRRLARVTYDARLRLAEEIGEQQQRKPVVDVEFRPRRPGKP